MALLDNPPPLNSVSPSEANIKDLDLKRRESEPSKPEPEPSKVDPHHVGAARLRKL